MLMVYLWLIFKLSALFPFPLVWCALKPKLSFGGGAAILALSNPLLLLLVICQMFVQPQRKSRGRSGRANSSANRGVGHQVYPGQQTPTLGEHKGQNVRGSHLRGSRINSSSSPPWHGKPQTHSLGAMPSQSPFPAWSRREQGMTQDCSEQGVNYSSHSHVCTGCPKGSLSYITVRHLRVDRAGRCFQPHNLGNAQTQTKPFGWSLPLHHNQG